MELALIADWKRWPCEEAQLEEVYAKEFAALGHRVHWLFFVQGQVEAERRLEWHGHPVTLLRRERGTLLPLRRWLSSLLAGGRIDLVQVRNDPGFALAAKGLARAAGAPLVYHLSILNGPVLLEEASREPLARSLAMRLKGLVGGALVDRVARDCDLLVPVSEAMAAHYRALGRRGPCHVMPMGCRDSAYREPQPRRGPPEAIYVGALDRVRRLDFLLRALVAARREAPDLRLVFLGSARRGTDREWLRAEAGRLGLSSAVAFEDPVPRERVAERIARADFGVSPVPPTPYYLLSSPTKLMEYLAVGRPAVANDIPDQRDMLAQTGGGVCVRYDEAAFGSAMARLARDGEARAKMGRLGAAGLGARRDYALLARETEKAYQALLSARGDSR